ncbi:MAG: preprotein translocase subunit SecE [Syntrophobacteraceae bacterium]
MNLPKLFQKKNEGSSGKVQSIETARKASVKTAAAKPARTKKAEGAKKAIKKPGEPSWPTVWMNVSREYLREVVYELRKVVWPSRKETVGTTAVVLVIVGLSSVFLGVVDFILSRLVRMLVG